MLGVGVREHQVVVGQEILTYVASNNTFMKEICQNWVFVFGLPNYRRSWKCPVQDFHSNLLACNYAGSL